ncbi:hypothetical protein D3C72_1957600 [compost metagenome]
MGGIGFVEVFHDGDRLADLHLAVDEKGHQPLRIDPAVSLLLLLALAQMHRVLLITQSLELQHQAHPETCR